MPFHNLPIGDLHCDTAFHLLAGKSLDSPELQVNLPCMKKANIRLQVFAFFLPSAIPQGHRFEIVQRMIDHFEQEVEQHREDIAICRDSQEVAKAQKENKIAAILSVENGMAIENDLKKLETLYQRGIRMMTIIHTRSNEWVISSSDSDPAFDGLTAFGEKVIRTMNDLGMIVDLSHSHDRAVQKVLSVTNSPVIASHSCVHQICPTSRNLTDKLIRGIAGSGGLVGINLYPGFLDFHYNQLLNKRARDLFIELGEGERKAGKDVVEIVNLYARINKKVTALMATDPVPVSRIIDHIQYIRDLVGDDYIAFGSDFDGVPDLPEGILACNGFARIRQAMFDSDFSLSTIKKISMDNFLRVFAQVVG